MANVYGSGIDLTNAQKYLGSGYNFIDISKGGYAGPQKGDVVVGGSGVTGNLNDQLLNRVGAQRLSGADRYGTTSALQNYARQQGQTQRQTDATNYQNILLDQEQKSKADALRQAWEKNQLALNNQKATTNSNYDSLLNQLNSSYNRNKQGLEAGKTTVNNDYQATLNRINEEKAAVMPTFQAQRNQSSFNAALAAKQLREAMASQGLFNGGDYVSGLTDVNTQKQNAFNQADAAQNQFTASMGNRLSETEAQKAAALADIQQKLNLALQDYTSGQSDINAQRTTALNNITQQLALGGTQYNDNQKSLADWLASSKTAAGLKSAMEARDWADQQRQTDLSNVRYDETTDYSRYQDQLNRNFQQEQARIAQEQWQRQFDQAKAEADRAYQLDLQRLAKSSSGGGGGSSSSSYQGLGKATTKSRNATVDFLGEMKKGAPISELLSDLEEARSVGSVSNDEYWYVRDQLYKNLPSDNWALSLPQY